ncbi:MAG: undecaprenyl-diphosphate phosphatase [Bacteroides sp.]|nr:undecaprenyl-diphosphate phosphatase [Bacillota bacterium]MCM1394241.1 undecaprenyl-diphosphate phosphatase [[Eubacterium] siraeum]MCM1455258.1 undecaprenyl-diphosphate phosphatase [Bacteroides sp.]
MTWWQALILGIVQGASEFLPISSSGHLLLLEKLGVGQENLFFNIMVHVGTLVAVLIAMRKSWLPLLRRPFQKTTGYILLACVPTVALALIFKFFAPSLISGRLLGFGFVLTACLLIASEIFKKSQTTLLSAKTSILTGVLQGIAVLPGVSRSGATISALTLQGVEKSEAANFSFLLSIPIIIGSALLEGIDLARGSLTLDVGTLPLIIGTASAFISGLLSINLFMKLIKKHSMIGFAIYTVLLGIVVTLLPIWGIL